MTLPIQSLLIQSSFNLGLDCYLHLSPVIALVLYDVSLLDQVEFYEFVGACKDWSSISKTHYMDVPNALASLNWTPIFEWYVVCCDFKS